MNANTLNPNDRNLSADKLLSGLITVDVGGRITYANNEAAQIFNLPVKQLTKKNEKLFKISNEKQMYYVKAN